MKPIRFVCFEAEAGKSPINYVPVEDKSDILSFVEKDFFCEIWSQLYGWEEKWSGGRGFFFKSPCVQHLNLTAQVYLCGSNHQRSYKQACAALRRRPTSSWFTFYILLRVLLPSVLGHILVRLSSWWFHICTAHTAWSWQTTCRPWTHVLATAKHTQTHVHIL